MAVRHARKTSATAPPCLLTRSRGRWASFFLPFFQRQPEVEGALFKRDERGSEGLGGSGQAAMLAQLVGSCKGLDPGALEKDSPPHDGGTVT